jgi:hypothetical protein
MAGIAAGGEVHAAPAVNAGRRRAAGIYGAIITAAILDTAGDRLCSRTWSSFTCTDACPCHGVSGRAF